MNKNYKQVWNFGFVEYVIQFNGENVEVHAVEAKPNVGFTLNVHKYM